MALPLILAVVAWALAQALKMVISSLVNRTIDWNYLWTGGGMPSSHSALVCACASCIGWLEGIDSSIFAVAAVLAFVVMYDAANVRKETGEQAKILNYMMKNWHQHKPEFHEEELKELIGHTPLQVTMGALLGVLVGIAGTWFLVG